MRITSIDPKAPAEVVPVEFDFSELMSSIDSVVISITVKSGTDAAVASMILGSEQITGTEVKQLIQNGVDQTVYLIRADATQGSEKYALGAYMKCEELD